MVLRYRTLACTRNPIRASSSKPLPLSALIATGKMHHFNMVGLAWNLGSTFEYLPTMSARTGNPFPSILGMP